MTGWMNRFASLSRRSLHGHLAIPEEVHSAHKISVHTGMLVIPLSLAWGESEVWGSSTWLCSYHECSFIQGYICSPNPVMPGVWLEESKPSYKRDACDDAMLLNQPGSLAVSECIKKMWYIRVLSGHTEEWNDVICRKWINKDHRIKPGSGDSRFLASYPRIEPTCKGEMTLLRAKSWCRL